MKDTGIHSGYKVDADLNAIRPRSFLLIGLLVFCLVTSVACHSSVPTLNLLVWEGYADPSFVQAFEQSHHCRVTASYMGSSDELVAKLKGGGAGTYDVISPSSDVAWFIVNSGLATPLELSHIPSYSKLAPKLTSMPLVKKGGQTYGVPFTWGPDPMIYDTQAFHAAPSTWNVLWDPHLRNKVSVWDDISTIYLAAQVLGFDKPDPSHLYNLTDSELEAVKKKLIEMKPNVRKYWSTGGELTNLFQNHEVVVAVGWPLMTNQLQKQHFPVAETIPRENTTGWIDHMMITAGSQHKQLAEEFLEYLIQAKTQKMVADVTGYIPANPGAAQFMSPEQLRSLHLDNLDEYQKRINFWQYVPRREKYNEIWNEVKAAA